MSEQKKAEEFGITEDDVSEIRQVELEMKVKRRFAKILQSRTRPLHGEGNNIKTIGDSLRPNFMSTYHGVNVHLA